MPAAVARLPLFVQLCGVASLSMFLPAAYGFASGEPGPARVFLFAGVVFGAATGMLGMAVANYRVRREARAQLLALLGAYVLIPLMLAVPLAEAVGNTRYLNAYFEMVSCLTTTGATVYDGAGRVPATVDLWRALVGWMGGLLAWVTAIAVLAPLNLGGFEVLAIRERTGQAAGILNLADTSTRVRRYTRALLPIYAGLTLALWVSLLITGEPPLVAISHAMSTMATSGISPGGGTVAPGQHFGAELVIFIFLIFALSRRTFEREGNIRRRERLLHDPELRMGLGLVVIVPGFLFLRHWWGALDFEAGQAVGEGLRALWGGMFTVMSFLTTTGFESTHWEAARTWSGLDTPGLVLVGLALFGGGVATTAGGVKLLRVYALFMHGRREVERLIHPSSVGGAGAFARHLRTRGAQIAWIFFMLFAMTVAAAMLALSLAGLGFESAAVFSIAALSNTGPLPGIVQEVTLRYADLRDSVKLILAACMVLGRLETLAIIALINPEFWRG